MLCFPEFGRFCCVQRTTKETHILQTVAKETTEPICKNKNNIDSGSRNCVSFAQQRLSFSHAEHQQGPDVVVDLVSTKNAREASSSSSWDWKSAEKVQRYIGWLLKSGAKENCHCNHVIQQKGRYVLLRVNYGGRACWASVKVHKGWACAAYL
eukprot:1469872-Amphidinium_carterae.2